MRSTALWLISGSSLFPPLSSLFLPSSLLHGHETSSQSDVREVGGLAGSALIRAWMSSLDYRVAYYDPKVDPVHPDCAGQKIYIFWHEYILFPLVVRGHCNLAMLLSRHGDAEILSRVAYHFGFDLRARFDSPRRRRGVAGTGREEPRDEPDDHTRRSPRTAARAGAGADLSGLEAQLAAGAAGAGIRSSVAGPQLGPLCRAAPFSRARAVVSPAIHLPGDLDRDGVEHYRREVEQLLNRLTLEAEAWAESGGHKLCEQPVRREHPKPARCGEPSSRRTKRVSNPPRVCVWSVEARHAFTWVWRREFRVPWPGPFTF